MSLQEHTRISEIDLKPSKEISALLHTGHLREKLRHDRRRKSLKARRVSSCVFHNEKLYKTDQWRQLYLMQQQEPHNHVLQLHTCTQCGSWSSAEQMIHAHLNAAAKLLGKWPCFTLDTSAWARKRQRVSEEEKETNIVRVRERENLRHDGVVKSQQVYNWSKDVCFPFQFTLIPALHAVHQVNVGLTWVCRLVCQHVKALSLWIFVKCW